MKTEILAPAGGWDSLRAAVRCGAHAVYLGGKALNARRSAENFDGDALVEAVRFCHARGAKVYLTLNTVVFDRELPDALSALEQACGAGVDGVIVQDLAVARLVRERAPSLPLHASTQMSVHDIGGALLLEELGFSRVVLARELCREEIAAIGKATRLELEVFVHGALCMCVSGQCYLSSMIGGRSGNRGLCAQPCRLPFQGGGKGYALSLRDMSLIRHAPELAEMGVAALKIEGRMKRPEYVAAAVTACKDALSGRAPDYGTLEAVFSRDGFTDGYYTGQGGDAMFGIRGKEDVTAAATVLRGLQGLYQKEQPLVAVAMDLRVEGGSPAALTLTDPDGRALQVEGPLPETAQTAPTTPERAKSALGKTGGTFYTISSISTKIDKNLILPASALNRLRREGLEALTRQREQVRPIPFTPGALLELPAHRIEVPPEIRVRLHKGEQLTPFLGENAHRVVVPAEEWGKLPRQWLERWKKKVMVEIPAVVFAGRKKLEGLLGQWREAGVADAVAGSLGAIHLAREWGFSVHGDFTLNLANGLALEEGKALGLSSTALSIEATAAKIRRLGGTLPRGIVAYGYLPLMTTRNCPAGKCGSCGGYPQLTDRKGRRFFLTCGWGASRLHNCVPLYLGDQLDRMTGVDYYTLYYTRESPEECGNVLRRFLAGAAPVGEITRGLYFREVL